MDPWSKEGLLTERPGGNHGDGGPSGDQSSLRQGADTRTSSNSDLGIAATEGHWRRSQKMSSPRVSGVGRKYIPKGDTRGGPTLPGDQGARPAPGPSLAALRAFGVFRSKRNSRIFRALCF